jgi:hypothetical protein
LYPEDAPAATPVSIKADGNCLPRCGSLLAFGQEDFHKEMRVRIIMEFALHQETYLDSVYLSRGLDHHDAKLPTIYGMYSGEHVPCTQQEDWVRTIFYQELLTISKGSRDMGIWQLHALATVLGTPIQSVYPQYGGYNVRKHLHRLILPRNPPAESTIQAVIMWTRTTGKAVAPHMWSPNHFVVCVPNGEFEGFLFVYILLI